MSRKWRNWYQNEVDEEIKGVDSRDKVKHNARSDELFFFERIRHTFPRYSYPLSANILLTLCHWK